MNEEKSLKLWKIKRETRFDKVDISTWVRRKEFKALTEDKHCFGKTIEGIKPEQMTDDEYMEFIKPLPDTKLRL